MFQFEEAIEFLNDHLNRHPYSEVAWHHLGRQYGFIGKYEEALASLEFAIISDDEFLGAYLEKGKVLQKMKKFPEAIETYTITLGLEDPTAFALLNMGRCYEKMNDKKMAIQYYTKCVEEDPLLDKGWIAITDFHYKNKDFQEALNSIDQAISINPENPLYWKRFAKINKRLGLDGEAEAGFQKVLEFGFNLKTWIKRGDILIKFGQFKGAKKNFKKAAEYFPEMAEIEYRLAGIHYSLKEPGKGKLYLKRALGIDPENLTIFEKLFPVLFQMASVQKIIINHKNPTF